jgi:RNA polymerase sigma factor for flagellar operon FliA
MDSALKLYKPVMSTTEALVHEHMPMVKRVAVHLKVRLPPFMDIEELVQVGMVGLIEAAQAFDPAKCEEFERFALSRIRGSMVDEVRRLTGMPRSAVAFQRTEEEAARAVAGAEGRPARSSEVAAQMGLDLAQFHKERDAAYRYETHSIEVVDEEALSVADARHLQPDMLVEHRQMVDALTRSVEALAERERLVLKLYYVEELNLKEIGAVLEVTESRVSQILSGLVRKLRSELLSSN